VNTGVFNVLRDEMTNHVTVEGNSVHLNLFGVFNVLGNDDWVIAGDFCCLLQELSESIPRVHRVHGCSGQDIGRSDKHWVGHLVTELSGLLDARKLLPSRLVDVDTIEHTRELVSVLCVIDHFRRRSKNLDVKTVQRQGNVVRGLTTHGDDDAARVFHCVDVEDGFERDVFKVKAVRLVIVGGDLKGY
jgi:hypothetical protein